MIKSGQCVDFTHGLCGPLSCRAHCICTFPLSATVADQQVEDEAI